MKDLRKRLIPALLALAISIPLLLFRWGFAVLIAIVALGITREIIILQKSHTQSPVIKNGLMVVNAGMLLWTLYYLAYHTFDPLFSNQSFHNIPHTTYLGFVVLSLLLVLNAVPRNPLSYAWLYPWFGLMSIIEITFLSGEYKLAPFLLLLVSIWLADAGAYFVGNWKGKRKLAPTISPNKTVEGFFGALLGVTLAIFVGIQFVELSALQAGLWILAVWLAAVAGDLFESLIKRRSGVKDSGLFLPGHGGFLDRFDSLIFAAPFVFVILKCVS